MKVKIFKYSENVAQNVFWARSFFQRLIGLLGRSGFEDIDGIMISPCSQVHSFGMKFNFDVIYLDNTYRVIAVYENVKKNKVLPYNIAVKNVLELPVGTINEKKIEVGDILKVVK